MHDPLEQRLARLELHLTHVERQNEELNTVVIEQARTLSKLQAAVRRLSETVETTELDRLHADTRKPPHSA